MREHGAFILARYSTDNQNADSIEVQVEKCSRWCEQNNMPILGVFADFAVSGMKDTRPQYEAMMAQLRRGGADTVVIYDQSRMFRKMTAWFAFRDELASMDVKVISVTQPLIGGDLRDPANFLNEGVGALFAQMWALQTRQKVMEKMRYMAKNGQHTGGKPPLGYRIEEGRLVIDEAEAVIVRRIFREYAAGYSYKSIIDGLNRDGYKTKRGNPFGSNSLHDLLHNEKYIGVLSYGKALHREDGTRNTHHKDAADLIRIEDAHAPIIDKETFDKVQERMNGHQRDRGGRPSTKRDYPLKGKVFCGECKAPMHISTSKYTYDYYKCSEKKRTHLCDNRSIGVDELEKVVCGLVRRILGQRTMTDALVARLRQESDALQSGAARRIQVIISQQAEISKKLENAADAVLAGLNSPTITKRIKDLESQKSALDREAKALKQSVDASALPERRIREILDIVLSDDSDVSPALLAIVSRVEVSKDRIDVWTIFNPDHKPTDTIDYTQQGVTITDGVPSAPPIVIVTASFIRMTVAR